jgi:hypothetical protein
MPGGSVGSEPSHDRVAFATNLSVFYWTKDRYNGQFQREVASKLTCGTNERSWHIWNKKTPAILREQEVKLVVIAKSKRNTGLLRRIVRVNVLQRDGQT